MRNAVLVGSRVYLRPREVADADASARWNAEERDTAMYRGRTPRSAISYAEEARGTYTAQPPVSIPFAVCLIADDSRIGGISVNDLDWVNRTAETGSFFGPEYRDQGYGTEAKHLLLEYCFDRLHLHTIASQVDETNPRSAAALAKQGYRPAGRTRWREVKDGVYVDWLVFSLVRADWLAARDVWRAGQSARTPRV